MNEKGTPQNLTRKGRGRPKGAKNKTPQLLKDMILQSLSEVGGVAYLKKQSTRNPNAYMALIGRVLPLQVVEGGKEPMVPKPVIFKQLPND